MASVVGGLVCVLEHMPILRIFRLYIVIFIPHLNDNLYSMDKPTLKIVLDIRSIGSWALTWTCNSWTVVGIPQRVKAHGFSLVCFHVNLYSLLPFSLFPSSQWFSVRVRLFGLRSIESQHLPFLLVGSTQHQTVPSGGIRLFVIKKNRGKSAQAELCFYLIVWCV